MELRIGSASMCFTGWYGHVCALVHSEGMGTYVHNLIMTHDKGNNYIAFMGCGIGSVGKSIFCERMRTWVQWILTNHVKVGHDYIQAYNPSAGGRKEKKGDDWSLSHWLRVEWHSLKGIWQQVREWGNGVLLWPLYMRMHTSPCMGIPILVLHTKNTIAFVFHLLSLCILCIVWFIFNVRCVCVHVCSCVYIYYICAGLDPGSNI